MKRFLMVVVLVMALTALLASTVLAAGPVNPTPQGFGPGRGVQAQECTPGECSANMARRGAPEWAGQPADVATLLGMTAEEIQAERQAGKSLAQIAASKGVSVDALVDTILTAKKAKLAELVASGKLTQAQADQMVERMSAQIKVMVERTTTGPAENRGQGMRQVPDDNCGQGMHQGQGVRGWRFNR